METTGEIQTSMKMISSGWEDITVECKKGNLWLLLERHALQLTSEGTNDVELKLLEDKIRLSIWTDGCPNLLCQL